MLARTDSLRDAGDTIGAILIVSQLEKVSAIYIGMLMVVRTSSLLHRISDSVGVATWCSGLCRDIQRDTVGARTRWTVTHADAEALALRYDIMVSCLYPQLSSGGALRSEQRTMPAVIAGGLSEALSSLVICGRTWATTEASFGL